MTGMLVILRHGQSEWNLANLFTLRVLLRRRDLALRRALGATRLDVFSDVALTDKGRTEAADAGRTMAAAGLRFDTSHTSLQTRAVVTQNLALDAMDQAWLPVDRNWRLNERHYGALQGLDKKQTTERHGAEQVHAWRRSYDTPPPPVALDSPEHPANDSRYSHLPPDVLPATECLKDVVVRVLPYWYDRIAPQLLDGLNVLVTAHGNSLRDRPSASWMNRKCRRRDSGFRVYRMANASRRAQ